MNIMSIIRSLTIVVTMALLSACGSGSNSAQSSSALSANNVNLVFVVSPDLAYQTAGDVQQETANLTNQGLNRSLMLASYLKQQILGGQNVTGIYALAPMTHLQTVNSYPDMAALWFVQQFAMLNQNTIPVSNTIGAVYTANSYPINTSYTPGYVPSYVAQPYSPTPYNCFGLDFNNTGNDAVVSGIINKATPGYYVFSAPWETIKAMMTTINSNYGLSMALPTTYMGSNYVYAISIKPNTSIASLITYNSALNPSSAYPILPSPVASATCSGANTNPAYFSITATSPAAGINTNMTMYLVRHAEAHPSSNFENGNYVAAGQWRALALAGALKGKINPSMVYSIDPAQPLTGYGGFSYSYVRPSLTVAPYAMANNLPYNLVSSFNLMDPTSPASTVQYFFFNPKFSGKTILLAWEHDHIPLIVDALLAKYANSSAAKAPTWPGSDYDTIWTVTLDANGNLSVNNGLCEGISLPNMTIPAPQF